MVPGSAPPRVSVVVDDRERRSGLAEAIAAYGLRVSVERLATGDVAVGARVLIERKTIDDFVRSMADRRLFDQAYALRGACARPLVILEGREMRGVSADSLRAVLVSLTVGYGIPIVRTECLDETAVWVGTIAQREAVRLARRAAATRERATSRTAIDVLAAIPGVGAHRARNLVASVGPPGAVLNADERTLREVPGVGPVTAAKIRALGVGPPTSTHRALRRAEDISFTWTGAPHAATPLEHSAPIARDRSDSGPAKSARTPRGRPPGPESD